MCAERVAALSKTNCLFLYARRTCLPSLKMMGKALSDMLWLSLRASLPLPQHSMLPADECSQPLLTPFKSNGVAATTFLNAKVS